VLARPVACVGGRLGGGADVRIGLWLVDGVGVVAGGATSPDCSSSLMSISGSPNNAVSWSFAGAGRLGPIGRIGCFGRRRGSGGGSAIRAASFFAWSPDERSIRVPTRGGFLSNRVVGTDTVGRGLSLGGFSLALAGAGAGC